MNEQPNVDQKEKVNYLEIVSSPGKFWYSLETWLRVVIYLFGAFLGFIAWVMLWTGLFPLVVFAFLGSNTAALVAKIVLIVAIVGTFGLAVVGVPYLVFLIIFAFAHVFVKADHSSSFSDFVIKK